MFGDIVGLRCRKWVDDGWLLIPAGPPIYEQDLRPPFGKKGDVVDVVVDDVVPYQGIDDEFKRIGKTFINDKLVFMQNIKPYTIYTRLVPVVMAQEVDITLESVDELPPTESQQLQAAGSGPTLRL